VPYLTRILLLPLTLASGCAISTPSPFAEAQEREVRTAVLQRFDSLTDAIRRLDAERMLSFYAMDSSVVRALDGQLIIGRRAVEDNFRQGFATVRSFIRLEVVDRYFAVLGPGAAVLTVRLEEQFADTSGHVAAVRATWTSAWKARAGEWRITHDAAVHMPQAR
jgi:uncharacterized protein (TIGR02246 family)